MPSHQKHRKSDGTWFVITVPDGWQPPADAQYTDLLPPPAASDFYCATEEEADAEIMRRARAELN